MSTWPVDVTQSQVPIHLRESDRSDRPRGLFKKTSHRNYYLIDTSAKSELSFPHVLQKRRKNSRHHLNLSFEDPLGIEAANKHTTERERERERTFENVSYPPEEVSLVVELPVLREEDKADLFYTHVEIISFLRDYQREEKEEEEEEEKRLRRQQKLLKRKRLNPRGRPWKRPTTDDGDSQPILPSRTDDDDDDDDDQSNNGHDMDSGNPPRPRKRLRRQDATIVPDVPT